MFDLGFAAPVIVAIQPAKTQRDARMHPFMIGPRGSGKGARNRSPRSGTNIDDGWAPEMGMVEQISRHRCAVVRNIELAGAPLETEPFGDRRAIGPRHAGCHAEKGGKISNLLGGE